MHNVNGLIALDNHEMDTSRAKITTEQLLT